MKKISIDNAQAKASWASIEVNVPESLTEAIALYGNEVSEILFDFAMEKSNLAVRLRSIIKDSASAQTVVDNFFKGLVASAMTANDMLMKLLALVGQGLLTVESVAKFVDAKKVSDKQVVYKALLVDADVAKENIDNDIADAITDEVIAD